MHVKSLAWLAVLAATPAAAFNWPQPGLNAAHTGDNKKETTIGAANIGSLVQKWAAPIPNGVSGPPPVEMNGVAYAQSTDGTVYAVAGRTGAVVWTYAAGNTQFAQGITSGGNAIYTTCQLDQNRHSGICALNAKTGAMIWKSAIPDCGGGQPPFSSAADNVPVFDHGMVFFAANFGGFNSACSGDYLYALNATTGKLAWPAAVAEVVSDHSGGMPLAVDKGRVFYPTGGANINICAVNEADGMGSHCSAGLSGEFADRAALSVAGGKLLAEYDVSSNGNPSYSVFTAFDETTLAIVWSNSVQGGTSDYRRFTPTVANGLAYFVADAAGGSAGSATGNLYALSLTTGKQVWSTYPCPSTACLVSGVSAANGVLFASCAPGAPAKGDQCAFNAKTGALLRQYGSTDNNAGTASTPLVANGAVIGACGGYGGNLCKFAP